MLIAATDGLWDNTYDDEVMQFLPESPDDLQRVSLLARSTLAARTRTYDQYELSHTPASRL